MPFKQIKFRGEFLRQTKLTTGPKATLARTRNSNHAPHVGAKQVLKAARRVVMDL